MSAPRPPVPAPLTSLCTGCGARLVWGTDDQGTRIPLDPTPPTYVLTVDGEVGRLKRSMAYVPHLWTCKTPERLAAETPTAAARA